MRCPEFLLQLDANLDTSEPPSAAFLEHASICPRCRDKWEEYRVLDEAIFAWKRHAHQFDVSVSSISAPSGSARQATTLDRPFTRRSSFRMLCGAVLAAACLAIVAVWFAEHDAGDHATVPLATKTAGQRALKPARPETGAVNTSSKSPEARDAPTAESAYLALAWNTTESVTSMVALLIPDDPMMRDVPPDDAGSSWINNWGQTLKPIGQDVEQAFEKLLDSLHTTPRTTERRMPAQFVV